MDFLRNLFSKTTREAPHRFQCNICGKNNSVPLSRLTREQPTCRCGSTVRLRSLIHVLSIELFGETIALPDFPYRPDIIGIDMSGANTYADRLHAKLGYTNTFLHKEPQMDIVSPGDHWYETCDFVISSDVFEHVAPPVSRAFCNTHRILKTGGVLVLTVPYTTSGETLEHFPDLHEYQIETRGGRRMLTNTTVDGHTQEFENLLFHGGEGETLEMRVFSESGLIQELEAAGFSDIHIHREEYQKYGIFWPQAWSLPISARRSGT